MDPRVNASSPGHSAGCTPMGSGAKWRGLESHIGTGAQWSWPVGHMPFALHGHFHPLGPIQLCWYAHLRKVKQRGLTSVKNSPPNSSCPSYLDLTLIAPSVLFHPYCFRILPPWRNPYNAKQECWGKYTRHKANQKKVRRNITDVIYYLQGKNQNAHNFYIGTSHDIFQMDLGLWFLVYKVSFSNTYSFRSYLIF